MIICVLMCNQFLIAQSASDKKKIKEIDTRIQTIVEDWNVPGCAIGIVRGDKLIYAKGFGYRDVENKLPVTPNTLFGIGSNTKLFTATAIGFLVEEEKLEWDEPIRSKIPSIQFYNDQLNNSITLRDMLSHRTGLNSPDGIWFYSKFSRHELFEKLKYCEPVYGFREKFRYNNFMYMAAGEIIELISGKTWEEFVKKEILDPLKMTSTNFFIEEMIKSQDFAKPYMNNYIDNTIIAIEYNRQMQGMGPAGSINSNINEMANWVICQLNKGEYKGNQIIPSTIINETMNPSFISNWYDNIIFEEMFKGLYGLGRVMTTYKGHLVTEHGGSIDGFLSQVTLFPDDDLGIIILQNTQTQPLRNFLQYEIADKILDLEKTNWHERVQTWRKGNIEGYKKYLEEQKSKKTQHTKPLHKLEDYVGVYENEIYGKITIELLGDQLRFQFYIFDFPLNHITYDHFETPENEQYGQYEISFITNDEGIIDKIQMDIDKPNVVFEKESK